MPEAIINNTHLTFSEDTKIITQDMVGPYQNTVTHITVPEGVTYIGNHAFQDCTGLTHVTFPATARLTTIGNCTFNRCTRLTHITFPDGLYNIGNSTFSGCTGLTRLTFPDSLARIPDLAFRDCTGHTHINFANGLTTIGNHAFLGCTGLQHILIPQSLEHHDEAYWQHKGIYPERTRIITKTQLQAFARDKKVDSHTNTHEITTLFLVDQGHLPLPQARDDLSIRQRITQLSLSNLFKLPALTKNLILPGFATYQNLTIAAEILSEALAPLGRWVEPAAALSLASWLSWQDIARIWLAKAQAPRQFSPQAVQAGQICRHKNTAKRHDKGYPKDDNASANASFAMRSLLSQRPRSTHPNHQHANPRTSCTKN